MEAKVDLKTQLPGISEIVKDRLYFMPFRNGEKPKPLIDTHYFSIDKELIYENFYADFGPLNIAMLYNYCQKLEKKFSLNYLQHKKIIHFTSMHPQKRVNAAYLIGAYAVIYLGQTPEEIVRTLSRDENPDYILFRDASAGVCLYQISLLDCLNAIAKAKIFGFFDFNNFDSVEYEHYERVENGDFNWILPDKFIAFCGPHSKSKIDTNGYPLHSPETYFSYFRRHKVTTVIRLNWKVYDSSRFQDAGFVHKDLFFLDGTTPTDSILKQFLGICESTTGAVAVHCKAGLGRTGSLIGCYIMKHYRMTARETIAWIRICRPGSIIGHQQKWLESKQAQMWAEGDLYRKKHNMPGPIKHSTGIYSLKSPGKSLSVSYVPLSPIQSDTVNKISQKVDTMKLNDESLNDNNNQSKKKNFDLKKETGTTQGDKLNKIKAMRRQNKNVAAVTGEDTKLEGSDDSEILLQSPQVANKISEKKHIRIIATRQSPVRSTRLGGGAPASSAITATKVEVAATPRTLPRRARKAKDVLSTTWPDNNGNSGERRGDTKRVTVKSGKRALDKDKSGPQSIKILRRSRTQNTAVTENELVKSRKSTASENRKN